MNTWNIIYFNCRERYEFMVDHHSYTHNLSLNWGLNFFQAFNFTTANSTLHRNSLGVNPKKGQSSKWHIIWEMLSPLGSSVNKEINTNDHLFTIHCAFPSHSTSLEKWEVIVFFCVIILMLNLFIPFTCNNWHLRLRIKLCMLINGIRNYYRR